MIKLRNFSLADLEKVTEIEKASFPDPWSKSYIKKLFEKHPNGFVIAELSQKIVGYILGHKKLGGSASIKTIAVNPDYRRKGIGTKLINFIIKRLKKEGAKEVILHTRTKNQTAHLFHKELGFKIVGQIENYYPNGDNAYLMKKGI